MVILIGGLSSDTGKSTIAVHWAAWLHERGGSVAFVDADAAQGNGSAWLRLASPGVPAYTVSTPEEAFEVIPQVLAEHCIVDGPSGDAVLNWSLMLLADLLVIPSGPWTDGWPALRRITRALGRVQQVREGKPSGLIVMNQLRERTRAATEALFEVRQLGVPVARTFLLSRSAYANARWQGAVVWRMSHEASAAEEMQAFLAEAFPGDTAPAADSRSSDCWRLPCGQPEWENRRPSPPSLSVSETRLA